MQKVYCDQSLCELFLLEDEQTIYKIAEEFCDVVTDLSDEEIIAMAQENPIVKHFIKRDSGNFYGDTKSFERIRKQDYGSFVNDILILPDNVDVGEIRKQYGILALHMDDSFPDEQNTYFGFTLNGEEDSPFKNWSSIFSEKDVLPVNSAILVDNYLWNNLEEFSAENGENLYPIMEAIIPKQLKVPFNLTIVILNKDKRFNPKIATDKIHKIEKNLNKRTGVEVNVGLITQMDNKIFHERVLLTNYHYVYSDKGFTIFKHGKLQERTKGDRNWVFLNIQNYTGELRKHHHNNVLKAVRDAYQKSCEINTAMIFNAGKLGNPLLN